VLYVLSEGLGSQPLGHVSDFWKDNGKIRVGCGSSLHHAAIHMDTTFGEEKSTILISKRTARRRWF
jgi:hypothetical protein